MFKKNSRLFSFLLLVLIISIILALIFMPYIIENKAFVIGYDIRSQYRPWLSEFRRLIVASIKTANFPFWSWNIFYGSNVWASKSNYFLTDIYSYFSLIIPGHIYKVLMFITGLKMLVAATTFYLYGIVRGWKNSTQIIGAILFAFSSWALKGIEHPFYLSFYSLVPLYFLSIELVNQKKYPYLYSVIAAILLAMNYYYFFSLSVVTIIYVIYRYYEDHNNFHGFIKHTSSLIGYYLLGVLIPSFIIFPTFLFIIKNNRVFNSNYSLLVYENIRVYFHLLIAWFIPSSTYISRIIKVDGIEQYASIYETMAHQTRNLTLWTGSFVPLIIVSSFFKKNSRKIENIILYLSLFILLFIPLGGSILHGFSEPNFRWTFFFSFISIVVSLQLLESNFDQIKINTLSGLILILILTVSNIPLLSYILKTNILEYKFQFFILLLSVLFYCAFHFALSTKKHRSILLISLVAIETLTFSFITLNSNPSYKKNDWEYVLKSESVLGDKYDEFNYYLSTIDPEAGFYRIYAPYESVYWYLGLNSNLLYNFSDIKTYDSTYQNNLNDLLLIQPFDRGLGWSWDIKQPEILDFSSVKYAIVSTKNELPHNNFDFIDYFRGFELYRNLNYRPIGNTYSKVISYEEYSETGNTDFINEFIIAKSTDCKEIQTLIGSDESTSLQNIQIFPNRLAGTLNSNTTEFVVTSIAYDPGWQVLVNNSEVKTFSVNGGFIGFPVPKGANTVNLLFTPSGFIQGIYVTVLAICILIVLIVYKSIKKR